MECSALLNMREVGFGMAHRQCSLARSGNINTDHGMQCIAQHAQSGLRDMCRDIKLALPPHTSLGNRLSALQAGCLSHLAAEM